MARERTCKPSLHVAGRLMFDHAWTTTIHHDQTAATSAWVVLYQDDRSYTTMGAPYTEGLPDRKTLRVRAMRASFTLAWSGVLLVGLRSSRGVSRRVERPPEWTSRSGW